MKEVDAIASANALPIVLLWALFFVCLYAVFRYWRNDNRLGVCLGWAAVVITAIAACVATQIYFRVFFT